MNLKELQTELGAVAGRLVELQNALKLIVGEATEATPKYLARDPVVGDVVECVGFDDEAGATARRCFTVGEKYVVNHVFHSDGLKIPRVRDDEGDNHDNRHVKFKVVAQ